MTGPYWDATNLEIDLIIAELLEVQLISLSTCQDYVILYLKIWMTHSKFIINTCWTHAN